jgi:curli biogenesis system outer membrane secretion channel CsgG
MKRLIVIAAILVCFTSALVAAQEPAGGLRYSVTVSKFENQAGWHGQWDIGDAWGTVLTDMLNQTGKFIVLGETDMRYEAMDEQDLAASGRTASGNKAPATGQLTPAQLLVKGAITHVQHDTGGAGGGIRVKGFKVGGSGGKGEVNATIYVVDSTTGQVLASTNVVGSSTNKGALVGYSSSDWGASFGGHKNDNVGLAVQDACAEAVNFIVGQLPNVPWTGSVVMVKGDKVYINRGSREGVSVGQAFRVGEVEVIRDPDTGEILDEDMTEICQIRASEVKEKLSVCDVTTGSAADLQKGMAIHPF